MNGRHVMQSCDTSLDNHRFKAYSFSFFIHEWQPCTNQNSWCVWDNTCTQHNHQGLLKKPQTNLLHDGGYDMFLCILAVELFKKVTNLIHFFQVISVIEQLEKTTPDLDLQSWRSKDKDWNSNWWSKCVERFNHFCHSRRNILVKFLLVFA